VPSWLWILFFSFYRWSHPHVCWWIQIYMSKSKGLLNPTFVFSCCLMLTRCPHLEILKRSETT
jgi:hypothetical protein